MAVPMLSPQLRRGACVRAFAPRARRAAVAVRLAARSDAHGGWVPALRPYTMRKGDSLVRGRERPAGASAGDEC